MFGQNYQYLCNKGRSAIFAIFRRLKSIGILPPSIMIYLFDSLVRPILTYGSHVWGVSTTGTAAIDKVFMWYLLCILKVKATTSNFIVICVCGSPPPSITCHISTLCYYKRLYNMSDGNITKQVFNELCRLNSLGFKNWVSKVCVLAQKYHVNIDDEHPTLYFKQLCKETVLNSFKSDWTYNVQNVIKNPILRTYTKFKYNFELEPYLKYITNSKHRNALSKLRASSHILEIERGRYTNPKTPMENRLCPLCNIVDDEEHLVMTCEVNRIEREELYSKVGYIDRHFIYYNTDEKFIFLMTSNNPYILSWLGKFIYLSFEKRYALL